MGQTDVSSLAAHSLASGQTRPSITDGQINAADSITGKSLAVGTAAQMAVSSAGNLATSGQLKSTSAAASALQVTGGAQIAGGFNNTYDNASAITFTANSYTVLATDSGKVLWVPAAQAASYAIALPAVATSKGFRLRVYISTTTPQQATISGPAGTVNGTGLIGKTSLIFASTAAIQGTYFDIYCDGAAWWVYLLTGATAGSSS